MVIDSSFFINLALKEAWKYQGLTYPNPAVGCTIVSPKNELLSVEAHKKSGLPHAEVMALRTAYFKLTNDSKILELTSSSEIHTFLLNNHNNCFRDISLYTTLEPCSHIGKTPSCASLISALGIKKVFVGFNDINEEASGGTEILKKSGVDVQSSILEKKAYDLIAPFNKWKEDKFVFFKWAQRLNGSTDAGTISSIESRINVHKMRNVCDLLVIGGNTVREDRPTLDARLVHGKAPDVLIISRKKEFDKSIALFGVEGREVFIEDNFSLLNNYKNIMIEGSSNMFELTKDIVDYYLCYLAPTIGGKSGFEKVEEKFEILNIDQEDQDIIMWMKREK
ncbi:riboflavin biosynthesis protein RibD [Sulfurimonas gotlandica GD1]|uniref:Riboflavin biosynthesis protein RibD n=1 Tax=Sulfurimonas gotlandica (strain DSM 19862 / JCM 16533 / GD1) TaxID=929558 RepID=B6BN20_SULGG|nr:bifunctional diaminohydroxyphosphoribosylaminopyrimidine deaminase/5-amino-6-(5-phosphoribosylamino)uracil reductase RibD [Sulfurimonas gotlandica]EDZ61561.1 riboflavin biosynthesis protein RibD [Sulfurimonas gotlandica GD1]EHP30704.1 riboflavin biosynthesis protein RibD [Sulfurimonas gotlandica GD1]